MADFETRALSLKMRRFAVEFARTRHATGSAIAAGYSPATARSRPWSWLRDPAVRAAIREADAAFQHESGVDSGAALTAFCISQLKAILRSRKTSVMGRLKALSLLQRFATSGLPAAMGGNLALGNVTPEPIELRDDDDGLREAVEWGRQLSAEK